MSESELECLPAERVPRSLVCAVLAVLWIFPSAGAILILLRGENSWRNASDVLSALGSVRLEQWLALALLAIHAIFIYCAFAGGGFSQLRRGISGRR